jgi:[acyl-carrier-protein] S-malonyltransferase
MGRDLYEAHAPARKLFEEADALLGRSISSICFAADEAALKKTANAQPAMFVVSMAALAVARESGTLEEPAFVAGHSLGEYSALAAAGAFAFGDALRLVEERGRLTQEAAQTTPGGMAALLGVDEESAAAICAETGAELCNINAPGQIVIGGTHEAVERACALAKERGARRAVLLDVDGAFHTSLMAPAAAPFRAAVESVEMRAPAATFVANSSGEAMRDLNEIREELVYQLTHPVRWVQCVRYMASQGVTTMVEIGPGRVLTGLIKRIAPEIETVNIGATAGAQA